MYVNVKSLRCTPETNILSVTYTLKIKRKKVKKNLKEKQNKKTAEKVKSQLPMAKA